MTIEEHIKKEMVKCPLSEEQESALLTGLENYLNEIEQLKNCNIPLVGGSLILDEQNLNDEIEQAHKRYGSDNTEIWKWWKEQKFQKEQGEQEYTMIYEIDLPKILKEFVKHFFNGA